MWDLHRATLQVSTPLPYLLQTSISMFRPSQCCCPYLQTWAGSHFKTNILDIMYISDFYSRAASFLPAWSWNHWLRDGTAMAKRKIQLQGSALNEPFNAMLHILQFTIPQHSTCIWIYMSQLHIESFASVVPPGLWMCCVEMSGPLDANLSVHHC